MAKWILLRSGVPGPIDYPGLGFSARPGDVYSGDSAPDAYWHPCDAGAPETVDRYMVPGGDDAALAALVDDAGSDVRASLSVTYGARQGALAPLVAPAIRPEWVTTFPAAHGWTADGTYTTFEDVTVDPALGSQAVRIVNGTASASCGISKTGLAAMDATDRVFVAWIKTPDLSRMASIQLLVGDGNFTNYFTLRTWLSGAAEKPTTNNRWTPIYFTFNTDDIAATGSPNRAAITAVKIRFYAHTNATSTDPLDVTVGGIGLVDDASALYPNGVVTFTFDDGYDTQIIEGKAYLDKYGFPATLYAIAEQADQPTRITLAQMKQARDVSGWEIAGHAYTEDAHTNRLTSLTDAELEAELANLKGWLVDNGFNSDNFCYPGGVFTDREIAAVGRYFSTARTTSTQPSHSLVPPPDPLMITQYDPAGGGESALVNAQARVDNAKADKAWVQFMIHRIGTGGISVADFQGLVDYVAGQGVAVRTVQQVMRSAAVEAPPVVAAEVAPVTEQTAYKAASTTRNNNGTKTADPDLTLTVEANSTYVVEAFLVYEATTTADLTINWSGPSGATMDNWHAGAMSTAASSGTSALNMNASASISTGTVLGGIGAGQKAVARPVGLLTTGGSAGSFALQWSQAVAEVSDAILYARSWLRLTKVG